MSDLKVFSPQSLQLLCELALEVVRAETVDEVFQLAARCGGRLLQADYTAVFRFSPVGSPQLVSWHNNRNNDSVEWLADLAVLRQELGHLRPFCLNQPDMATSLFTTHPEIHSLLSVPVLHNNELLAEICLVNAPNEHGFKAEDEQVANILAAYVAEALRKVQLIAEFEGREAELAQRNKELAALNQAAMAIAGELTLDKVLQQIVDNLRDLIGAQYAALGVPGPDGYLETFVYSGIPTELARKIGTLPRGHGLLGVILREKRPIRIPRISKDPRAYGFPPHHPPMESFLGVPIIAGSEVLGNLYLTEKIGADEFSASDQELVELLAAHAAIAIQNARLYEQVGRLAVIEERARIGMDLHDGIIQSIYAVGLTLESTRLALPPGSEEADKLLGAAIEALNDTIRDIRNFILDLRPRRFKGDLQEGLARLVREFQANTMIPVTLDVPPDVVANLPTPVVRAIFLTTQEALANIARHARATAVTLTARRVQEMIELVITDDGIGFDPEKQHQSVGHGLSNMRARAEELHGRFELVSALGQGTTVRLFFPTH
ncbi:MAG: GAF domain-containing protein [Chloroflexi bacterium]|nr:MAG: GAF domain-containing protein [Chloroflexota bacterium]